MNKMWEIRESDESRESRFGRRRGGSMMGRKESSVDEAYECGYEDGYRAAMMEAKHFYGERYGK